MHPIDPTADCIEGVRVVYGAGQPEYRPLPAIRDRQGRVMTEWELDEVDRAVIARGGRIRLWVWTFNGPLQPVAVEAVQCED